MVRIYCQGRHKRSASSADRAGLCPSCSELRDYAFWRLEKCPFGDEKPTCARCAIHCYRSEMREMIKEAMRYAGPRMVLRHPILALLHELDSLRGRRALPRREG